VNVGQQVVRRRFVGPVGQWRSRPRTFDPPEQHLGLRLDLLQRPAAALDLLQLVGIH